MNNQQTRQAKTGAWVGIIGNLILAVLKGGIGWFSHSRALMADAIHSASDVIGSMAVLIGVRAANLPPDEEHPYGHGKAESVAAIIVSILLGLAGLQIGYGSFKALFGPAIAPGWPAAAAAIVSMLAKEGMFRYKYMLGKRIGSQAIIANAWEHRSDVYSSVAALVGIGGALLGEQWEVPLLVQLDPVAGMFVSVLVLQMAWRLSKESIRSTLDQVLPEEESRELVKVAAQVKGVRNVDVLRARKHGFYVIVDIKVAVDSQLTVEEGHQVGKEVKRQLLHRFDHVADVLVHINPYHI